MNRGSGQRPCFPIEAKWDQKLTSRLIAIYMRAVLNTNPRSLRNRGPASDNNRLRSANGYALGLPPGGTGQE